MAARLSGGGGFVIYLLAAAVLVFVLAPLVVVVALSFSTANLAIFPPVGFTTSWYEDVIANDDFRNAFMVSVTLALASTLASFAIGVPAAYALNRWGVPGARVVEAVLLSPFILPVLIIGLALLQFMAMMKMRDAATNLFIGHVLVTLPYLVRTVTASLKQVDRSLEEAALTLGRAALAGFHQGHRAPDRAGNCRRMPVLLHGLVRRIPDLLLACQRGDHAVAHLSSEQHDQDLRSVDCGDGEPDDPDRHPGGDRAREAGRPPTGNEHLRSQTIA